MTAHPTCQTAEMLSTARAGAATLDNAVSRSHELHDQFPHDAQVLHRLKLSDTHFCNLAERYHAVTRAIHRIEVEVEAASDGFLNRLKRQRLFLLDEIAVIIEDAQDSLAAGTSPTPPAGGLLFGAPPREGHNAKDAVPA